MSYCLLLCDFNSASMSKIEACVAGCSTCSAALATPKSTTNCTASPPLLCLGLYSLGYAAGFSEITSMTYLASAGACIAAIACLANQKNGTNRKCARYDGGHRGNRRDCGLAGAERGGGSAAGGESRRGRGSGRIHCAAHEDHGTAADGCGFPLAGALPMCLIQACKVDIELCVAYVHCR